MDEDLVAQFVSITNAEVATANQYLEASDFNLESAIGLFYATGGVTGESQSTAMNPEPEVRERIEGRTDRIVDPDAMDFTGYADPGFSFAMPTQARRPAPGLGTGIFNQARNSAATENMSPHERRLAELFRPPFELLRDIDLEDAKQDAREEQKWILVNIQDPTEFSCQQLNRDLWRHESVRELIEQNFVFLQYDHRSSDGEEYRLLYPFDTFPHIAVLDPWTGEQVFSVNKVPAVEQFVEQLLEVLSKPLTAVDDDEAGSLSPVHPEMLDLTGSDYDDVQVASDAPSRQSTSTPVVKTEAKDPDLETEPESSSADRTSSIAPREVAEPPPGQSVTRLQLRMGDGQRIVRRFELSTPVSEIVAFVKHAVPALQGSALTLMADRRNLVDELDKTIEEANLKNSTILVDTL